MQQRYLISEQEPQPTKVVEVAALPKRALIGVFGLLVLTVGSLGLAWGFPDWTLLHFLWVAQIVPVLYVLLVWWGTQRVDSNDDAD